MGSCSQHFKSAEDEVVVFCNRILNVVFALSASGADSLQHRFGWDYAAQLPARLHSMGAASDRSTLNPGDVLEIPRNTNIKILFRY